MEPARVAALANDAGDGYLPRSGVDGHIAPIVTKEWQLTPSQTDLYMLASMFPVGAICWLLIDPHEPVFGGDAA